MIPGRKTHTAEINGGDPQRYGTDSQNLQTSLARHFDQRKVAGRQASQIHNHRKWWLGKQFGGGFVGARYANATVLGRGTLAPNRARERCITR